MSYSKLTFGLNSDSMKTEKICLELCVSLHHKNHAEIYDMTCTLSSCALSMCAGIKLLFLFFQLNPSNVLFSCTLIHTLILRAYVNGKTRCLCCWILQNVHIYTSIYASKLQRENGMEKPGLMKIYISEKWPKYSSLREVHHSWCHIRYVVVLYSWNTLLQNI